MYIEDLVLSISFFNTIPCTLNRFDKPIMESIADQCLKGIGFTNKQATFVIKILTKYSPQIVPSVPNINDILSSPTFKLPIREVTTSYKISIIDHSIFYKAIKLEFPFSQDKVEYIRKNRPSIGDPFWDADQRAWIFPLCESALVFLLSFIKIGSQKYDIDSDITELLEQTTMVIDSAEKYAPMLTVENNLPKYVNVSPFVPPIESTDIVEAMFEARLAGITLWHDTVLDCLERAEINTVTKMLLLSDDTDKYNKVNSDITPIDDLSEIINLTKTVLFVVPEHIALSTVEKVYEFLKRLGHTAKEMSVMFRLPSSSNSKFNEFVKANSLNSPITSNTKFVFVSVKMPKPVLASGFRPNCIINFGESNAHYTMRDFIKNSQNLIYFCPQRT